MELFGRLPVNQVPYYAGTFSFYLAWVAGLLQLLGVNFRIVNLPPLLVNASLFLAAVGLILFLASALNLGASFRFGLPIDRTDLKQRGVYAFSRNPMSVGFYLLTLGAMIFTGNPVVVIIGSYGLYTAQLIVLSEERFLQARFGQQYLDYCRRVRRYL
jgi:protein-S-isoprenylcysteine O-methyltransferase Ste14